MRDARPALSQFDPIISFFFGLAWSAFVIVSALTIYIFIWFFKYMLELRTTTSKLSSKLNK